MTTLSPPPPTADEDGLELLIREARARQRKRKMLAAATVAVLAAGVFAVYSVIGEGSSTVRTRQPRSLPIASLRTCRSNQLRLVAGRGGVAAGTYSRAFAFVNDSSRSCTLRGWPAIGLVLRNGRWFNPDLRRWHYYSTSIPSRRLAPRTIALRPGGAGSFIVLAQDASYTPGHPCVLVRTMSVTPPGAKRPLTIPNAIGSYCAALIVPPLVAGRTPPYP